MMNFIYNIIPILLIMVFIIPFYLLVIALIRYLNRH
jgi:hypothetical protein